MHIVLVEPEIHQNTGNIARTCAVTGTDLHLVKPLGFSLDDRYLRRAGLDYWPMVSLHVHEDISEVLEVAPKASRLLFSTKGGRTHADAAFADESWLFFGRESRGLPETFLSEHPGQVLRIPMRPVPGARSLNLATSVAVALFEGLRQLGFGGLR